MALTDEEYIQRLREKVIEYKAQNGDFNMPVKALPFYNVAATMALRPGFKEKNLTPADILYMCGVPADVYQPQLSRVTFDQLKREMDQFAAQYDIYNMPVKKTPFYKTIDALRRRPEYQNFNAEDFYQLAGYPIYRKFSVTALNDALKSAANEDGYVDSIKTRKKGLLKSLGKSVEGQAKRFGCVPAVYLLAATDFKFKDVIDHVDYMEFVRLEIAQNYKKGSDLTGIAHDDKKTYDKLRRVAMCTASSMQEVARKYGYTYYEAKADYSKVDTDGFEKYFLTRFSDRKVPCLADYPKEHKYAVSCARKLDTTVKELFKEHGFKYVGYNMKKLYRAHVDFSEDEEFILKAKKFYYGKSKVLNNPTSVITEIDKEKEQIVVQILKDYKKWKTAKNTSDDDPELGGR